MAKPKHTTGDAKGSALAQDGALNPHPEVVSDALFTSNPFFDARDLVQVRYEMVRRHQADGVPISEVASDFGGLSANLLQGAKRAGRPGFTWPGPITARPQGRPQTLGGGRGLCRRTEGDEAGYDRATQCIAEIAVHFGISVHRRSLERAMARKKKRIETL